MSQALWVRARERERQGPTDERDGLPFPLTEFVETLLMIHTSILYKKKKCDRSKKSNKKKKDFFRIFPIDTKNHEDDNVERELPTSKTLFAGAGCQKKNLSP